MFNNINNKQASSAIVANVRFYGEYRIGDGPWYEITEGQHIHGCSRWQKIRSVFTFPLYMATYIPIGFVALFKKVGWKPIQHTVTKSIEDIDEKNAIK